VSEEPPGQDGPGMCEMLHAIEAELNAAHVTICDPGHMRHVAHELMRIADAVEHADYRPAAGMH
jgi:hypothetical protein